MEEYNKFTLRFLIINILLFSMITGMKLMNVEQDTFFLIMLPVLAASGMYLISSSLRGTLLGEKR